MLQPLLTVFFLHWLVLLVPGANWLVVTQFAVSGQRPQAYAAASGIAFIAVVWAAAAILGLSALFAAAPVLRAGLQLLGGLYLMYIAFRLWGHAHSAQSGSIPACSWPAALRMGMLTNLTNPKSTLFFASVFATAIPAEPEITLALLAVLVVALNALVWHLGLAVVFSSPPIQAAYARSRLLIAKTTAALISIFALRALVQAGKDLAKL